MKKIQDIILQLAKRNQRIKTADVLASINNEYSRTYVSRIINELVKRGKLVKGGSTAGSFYVLPENKDLILSEIAYNKTFLRKGLNEEVVLDELHHTKIYLDLKDNVRSIFNYAFSEMLNNAIEHSESEKIVVSISKQRDDLVFIIEDAGVGVFKNIKRKKKLKSELEAIQDLLKGKTTTAPQLHSGEGIFFTSKCADLFSLDSYGTILTIDNEIKDLFVDTEALNHKGTKVTFTVSKNSNLHLTDLFKKYQTNQDTMAFDKTEVKVQLYTMGTIYVSRSQARRVLFGLNKFKSIVLDFDQVPMIGQGFADEIFRVYKSRHPEVSIIPTNVNDAVEFMIGRVSDPEAIVG